MATKVALGGNRLGSESKMDVKLHGWNRSSHNIGKIFRTDQSTGTIIPCFCDVGTMGTTYYLNLATKVRTLPTNGPIFGVFKHQIDVFQAPIRLYIGALHNNALGIGLNMKQIKLPMFETIVPTLDYEKSDLNSQQIDQSSLLAYLGVRGLGDPQGRNNISVRMPAIFMLMYWDIYKNYYSNKQEEVGYHITGAGGVNNGGLFDQAEDLEPTIVYPNTPISTAETWKKPTGDDYYQIIISEASDIENVQFARLVSGSIKYLQATSNGWNGEKTGSGSLRFTYTKDDDWVFPANYIPFYTSIKGVKIESFQLENIDSMREAILMEPKTGQIIIDTDTNAPYSTPLKQWTDSTGSLRIQAQNSQVGLGLRTYLSDRFNNWLSTEWIDGTGGINKITAIDVSEGLLQINELILQEKIFDMLNRIAVSDGTYKSWLEVNYDEKANFMMESPIYEGGLASEIAFDEVVSSSDATTAAGEDQPLGSLAGRGSDKNTRGKGTIKVKMKEPSMLMILESIVPRVDYSQGNKWWNKLETMDDLHKPALDAIGFQELPTDEICAFDMKYNTSGQPIYNSAGKQPSWIEYMTNVNETYGSFVAGGTLEHMAVNRKYSHDKTTGRIKDLTTYIDPTIYNNAFADHDLTSRNFWVQIAIDCTVRRKMSAKQIPNL